MTTIKHESKDTSTTPCHICREWERDMNGTLATLARERAASRKLLAVLQQVIAWAEPESGNFTAEEIEWLTEAKAAVAEAKGLAA
jgi:hypothetical protein